MIPLAALLVLVNLPLAASPAAVPVARFGWDGDASMAAARTCAEVWQAEGPALAAALVPAGAAVDTVNVLVMGSAEFARLLGGAIPDWGVGITTPDGRVVAIDRERLPAVGRGLRTVFLHEMVHALMLQAAGGVPMPAWFLEGAAQAQSGEWRFVDTVALVFDGRVAPLASLEGPFPADPHRADRAYRVSLLAAEYLADRHGPDAVARVLAAAVERGSFAGGFQAATGEPVEVFAAAFDARMRLRLGWVAMVLSWPTLFVLLGVVLGAAAVRRRAQARRRLEAMPDDEPASEA
ncbi:MAG TPA: hypothetical protein PLQ13_13450 [Candidatus Krumholzibacteria bacterium]|nr:hypothetical protein [Candidatus Krumholzibacteria bacterium]